MRDIFFQIGAIFGWSAILAFVPCVFYLMIKPLQSYVAVEAQRQGIFLVKEELQLVKEKKALILGLALIYGMCFLVLLAVCSYNSLLKGRFSLYPFEILSVFSVVLFWASWCAYLPFFLYIVLRRPWKYKQEAVFMKGLFAVYGVGLLFFSLIYLHHWAQENHVIVGAKDIGVAILTVLFFTTLLAYLPILIYVYFKISRHPTATLNLNVIFVICSLVFLVISFLYIGDWLTMALS